MATVRQIVTRAFRKLDAASNDDPLTGEELQEGIDALNAMIHGWVLDGVDLSWTDQAANDTFALDNEYLEGVVYLLAGRLSPNYTTPANFDADDWFRKIQAANTTITAATIPSALLNLPSKFRRGYTKQ